MSFNAICENKILAKISESTVFGPIGVQMFEVKVDFYIIYCVFVILHYERNGLTWRYCILSLGKTFVTTAKSRFTTRTPKTVEHITSDFYSKN